MRLLSLALRARWRGVFAAIISFLLCACIPLTAHALPAYARQTGQNCVACHAGGQFPELTPYGRLFKLTGYTIGAKDIPVAVMGVGSLSKSSDPTADPAFAKDAVAIFQAASFFFRREGDRKPRNFCPAHLR